MLPYRVLFLNDTELLRGLKELKMFLAVNAKDQYGSEYRLFFDQDAPCFGEFSDDRPIFTSRDVDGNKLTSFTDTMFGWDFEKGFNEELFDLVEDLIKKIPWFPTGLFYKEEIDVDDWNGDTVYNCVDFSSWLNQGLKGDKLIFCLMFVRYLTHLNEEELNRLLDMPIEKAYIAVLAEYKVSFNSISSVYIDYDWDTSIIHWQTMTQKRFKELCSLKEPHWKQGKCFSGGVFHGYKKSHLLLKDMWSYSYGERQRRSFILGGKNKKTPRLMVYQNFGLPFTNLKDVVTKEQVLGYIEEN